MKKIMLLLLLMMLVSCIPTRYPVAFPAVVVDKQRLLNEPDQAVYFLIEADSTHSIIVTDMDQFKVGDIIR